MSCATDQAPPTHPGAATRAGGTALADVDEEPQIDEELLIEEISIDGMCGVY